MRATQYIILVLKSNVYVGRYGICCIRWCRDGDYIHTMFGSRRDLYQLLLSNGRLTIDWRLINTALPIASMLNDNDIETIEDHAFSELLNLRKLWLTNNKIACIGIHTFSDLINLQDL